MFSHSPTNSTLHYKRSSYHKSYKQPKLLGNLVTFYVNNHTSPSSHRCPSSSQILAFRKFVSTLGSHFCQFIADWRIYGQKLMPLLKKQGKKQINLFREQRLGRCIFTGYYFYFIINIVQRHFRVLINVLDGGAMDIHSDVFHQF